MLTDSAWHLDSGKADSAQNMALDEALLEAMPRLGKPVLRFYGWTERAASFGYFQKYSEIEPLTLLRPLVRRPTGGGLVAHETDWTYSIAIPTGHEWYAVTATESYIRVHEWIQAAFAQINVPTEIASCCRKSEPGQCFIGHEKFDLLWNGQKIAGAAQRLPTTAWCRALSPVETARDNARGLPRRSAGRHPLSGERHPP